MNCIILSGNLCKDIKTYSTTSGKSYSENTIAVPKDRKTEDGKRESDFIDFVIFGSPADYLSKYGKKGDKVELHGSLRVDRYEDKEGNKKSRIYVIADKIQILTSRMKKEEKPF